MAKSKELMMMAAQEMNMRMLGCTMWRTKPPTTASMTPPRPRGTYQATSWMGLTPRMLRQLCVEVSILEVDEVAQKLTIVLRTAGRRREGHMRRVSLR